MRNNTKNQSVTRKEKCMTPEPKKKKKFKVPHTYVIIGFIILIMAVSTYIIPAGQYERVVDEATGRTVVDPDSFTYVEQSPIKPFACLRPFP